MGCIRGPGGFGLEFLGVCAGCVCGSLDGVGVPWGVGLSAAGVCGLPGVGGGEGCLAGRSVAGVCGCLGGLGRPVSGGPGLRAIMGLFWPPVGEWRGRSRGGGCGGGGWGWGCLCCVGVCVCLQQVAGVVTCRPGGLEAAAAARILQMGVPIW